jgi:hypothetical protein
MSGTSQAPGPWQSPNGEWYPPEKPPYFPVGTENLPPGCPGVGHWQDPAGLWHPTSTPPYWGESTDVPVAARLSGRQTALGTSGDSVRQSQTGSKHLMQFKANCAYAKKRLVTDPVERMTERKNAVTANTLTVPITSTDPELANAKASGADQRNDMHSEVKQTVASTKPTTAKVVVSGLIGLILMVAGIYVIVHSLSGGSSPTSSVIAGYNGTGTLHAGPVTVPGSWQIAWSYSCPNSVSTPDFVVARVYDAASVPASESVIQAARPPLLIEHGVSGSGTQPYTGAGNVTFVVATSTDCSWKLTVSG